MEQVIFGGIPVAPLNTAAIAYNSLIGTLGWGTTEFWAEKIVSTSGKIKNLRVKLNDSPGAGTKYTFTLMVNSNPSALTLEIADTATSGVDTTHEVDVVAGDAICLRCEPTDTPTARYATWTSMFEGATAKESLILGSTYNKTLSNILTEYVQVMTAYTDPDNTENFRRQVCPTSGKIKNLYVELDASPGTSPDAYRFTLRKNGASQTLTVTITAPNTTGNDTANEVAVAAGDVLTLMIEPLETPSAFPHAQWGMTFVADTDGESVILAGTDDSLPTTVTEYIGLQASDYDAWGGTESSEYQLGQSCTLKKLYLLLSAAPGAGKSYTFTLRKPGNGQADGNLTVTIADAATTGNDTVNTDAIADDDYVDLECTPAGTPDLAQVFWGVVGYIAPAVGLENKSAGMAAKMVAAGLL